MSEEPTPFVARDSDIAVLTNAWDQARGGAAKTLRLAAPFGGGRRAVANSFFRKLATDEPDTVIWRVNAIDQENGLQWLRRMYTFLIGNLAGDVLRRGKVEMMLNAQLPKQPKRVQAWYQHFIGSLKRTVKDPESNQMQVPDPFTDPEQSNRPMDNPLIGLVELTAAIAGKMPVVLEIQHPYSVNSLTLAMFLDAIHHEAKERKLKLMIVLYDEPESDITRSSHPLPLLNFYERATDIIQHDIAPWGTEETQKYLDSKGIKGNAARLAEIASGRPGFISELVEILDEKGNLDSDLEGVTFSSLLPMSIDEEELDAPEGDPAEGERTHATADDAGRVTYLAALLGTAFPSNLVADMGGFERDSIDDLFDAMGDLYEEVQFSQELKTWIYRFKRGSWREAVLELNDTEEGHDLGRRVGLFMERYLVPRGYGFIVKTVRVYAEHQAYNRAAAMRSLALTNDHPDVWGLSYDLTQYFDEVAWPKELLRTIYMNLMDRLAGGGNIKLAEQVHGQITEWATKEQEREMTAWLLYIGSRLDARRQDLFRARDRASDALKMYEALENKPRMAEVCNHIAQIELQDGNPNAALEQVNKAVELGTVEGPDGQTGVVPGIFATAEQIRGLVLRRSGRPADAAEHFKRANEVAGQAGIAALALESGLSYGEALLAAGKVREARDILERVLQIAQGLRNPARERNAAELLAQAEGALKNYDKALPLAQRVLQLTQALRFDQALPIDLYNLGFFHFVTQKPTEALTFFKQSEARIAGLGPGHPVVKELHYFKGLAHMQVGQLDAAKASLSAGLKPAREAKDWRKTCSALENLATIENQQGNREQAKKLLNDALGLAKANDLREERKSLRKKLDSIA